MTTQEQIQNVFSDLSSRAHGEGAALEISVGRSESFSVSYQQRKLKKYSADQSQAAVLRVLYGKGTGLATTENLSPEALSQAFDEALQSARDLNRTADPRKLEPVLLGPQDKTEITGLYHSDYSEVPVADKMAWAQTLEAQALEFDPRVTNVPYSGFSHSAAEKILLNSLGQNLTARSSQLSAYSYALAKQGDDSKTGSRGSFARDPRSLHPVSIAREAARRSVELLGAVQPKTGKWNVVFSNEVAADLIGLMVEHFSAKALDEGTSLLRDRKGQKVFSGLFTWTDDPFLAGLPAARAFDAEGAPSRRTVLVHEGRLENYLTNSYYARKMNLPHTAHAVRGSGEPDIASTNVIVAPGKDSVESLLRLAPETILITEVSALHSGFKDSTADFSLPASGLLYSGGEAARPLHQFVISGNLLDLLGRVTHLSNRWNDNGDSTLSPDLFVPEVSLAGQG